MWVVPLSWLLQLHLYSNSLTALAQRQSGAAPEKDANSKEEDKEEREIAPNNDNGNRSSGTPALRSLQGGRRSSKGKTSIRLI